MRLIGGNISDTPVKEVGDGSAFNVGGAPGAPDLVTIGSFDTAATLSVIPFPSITFGASIIWPGTAIIKWSDNSFGCFWLESGTPWELSYSHLTTNADGTYAAEATAVDLSGDFSTPNDNKGVLNVKKLSDSRIVVTYGIPHAARKVELAVYDKNGDSLTQVGSTLTRNNTNNANPSLHYMTTVVKSATTVVVYLQDQATTTTITGIPATVVGTQEFGSVVTHASATNSGGQLGVGFIDSAGAIFTAFPNGFLEEWACTIASPPVLTHTKSHTKFSTLLSAQGEAGGAALMQTNHDHEAGRFMTRRNNNGSQLNGYTGNTTETHYTFETAFPAITTIYAQATIVEVTAPDATTGWGRYIFVAPHSTDSTGTYLIPFNYNWLNGQTVMSGASDFGYSTNAAPTHNYFWRCLIGSSSATNALLLYGQHGAAKRCDVAITQ